MRDFDNFKQSCSRHVMLMLSTVSTAEALMFRMF